MTMATLTFRAAKHRNMLYGIFGLTMIMTLIIVTQTHSRLRKAEEDLMKCQQKHDSVAAQFTVLYEHKARLEKSLQAEVERKKLVDDELKTIQGAMSKEKINQSEKYSKLMRQFDELKGQQADDYSRLKATYEALRTEKEKLDTENGDVNVQNTNLKEANQKLEEEIHKMQQNLPVDMSEVDRLKERLKTCESRHEPNHEASNTVIGDGKAVEATTVTDNRAADVASPKAVENFVEAAKTSTVNQNHEEKPQENPPVLPAPQQSNKVSSTIKPPPASEGILVEPRPVPEDLNVRPVGQMKDETNQKRSYLGHQFGDNVDRKELPIFKQNKQNGGEERDYPENPANIKDDDVQGADDGEDAAERMNAGNKEENNFFNQEDNVAPNEDFDDHGQQK